MSEVAVNYAVYAKRGGDGGRTSSFRWTGRQTFPPELVRILDDVKFQWRIGAQEEYPPVVIVRDLGHVGALVVRCVDDGYDNENRPHTLKEECFLLP